MSGPAGESEGVFGGIEGMVQELRDQSEDTVQSIRKLQFGEEEKCERETNDESMTAKSVLG